MRTSSSPGCFLKSTNPYKGFGGFGVVKDLFSAVCLKESPGKRRGNKERGRERDVNEYIGMTAFIKEDVPINTFSSSFTRNLLYSL
jgi:hypothetical protein